MERSTYHHNQPVQPVPPVPTLADMDMYREMIRRHGHDNLDAYRYAEKVKGRVLGHCGGPSPTESRTVWEAHHPHGPSGRHAAPDEFALLFATELWDNDRRLQAELGMPPGWVAGLRERFENECVEVQQLIYNGQLYSKPMVAEFVRARLPGLLAQADSPLDWQRVVNNAAHAGVGLGDVLPQPGGPGAGVQSLYAAALLQASRTGRAAPPARAPGLFPERRHPAAGFSCRSFAGFILRDCSSPRPRRAGYSMPGTPQTPRRQTSRRTAARLRP